jgi:predicted small metal-binding protein
MSLSYEDCIQLFCVRCEDVGLDCNCVVFGMNEKEVMDETIVHMFEYHAINPQEMTSEMKSKIRENVHLYRNSLRAEVPHVTPDVSEKLQPCDWCTQF